MDDTRFLNALTELRDQDPERTYTAREVADEANLPHTESVLRWIPGDLIARGSITGYITGDVDEYVSLYPSS